MTTTLQEIDLGEIGWHAGNPRTSVGDVTELAASIEEKGILEPLIVAPDAEEGGYVLLAGHRRHAAAAVAGLQSVPCLVREDVTDPAAQLELMLVENLQRSDLTPVEEAAAYQSLLEFPGYTVEKIQKATGRSRGTVRSRLALAKLPERLREKLHTGQLSLADAQAITEFASDKTAVARLEAAAGGSNFRYELQQAKERRANAKLVSAAETKLRKAGVTMLAEHELPETENGDPAWVYVDPDGDLDDLRIPVEQHAGCPGHAAYVELSWARDGVAGMRRVAETHYVCTHPELHPELAEDSPEHDEAEKARDRQVAEQRAAAAARAEQLRAAAVARRQAVAATGRQLDKDETRELLAQGVIAAAHRVYIAKDVLADALGLEAKYSQAELDELIATQPTGVLVVLLDLVANAQAEDNLTNTYGWPAGARGSAWSVEQTQPWRQRLGDLYAYEWTDLEAELNTEPPPPIVDVNLPEPADDEDDVDEDLEDEDLEDEA